MTKLTKRKKLEKKNIMSKQYAHLYAMAKTSVKFQNDLPKTVGVSLTSQLLTNGRTDKRTGHGAPISHLRANAGAQKKPQRTNNTRPTTLERSVVKTTGGISHQSSTNSRTAKVSSA